MPAEPSQQQVHQYLVDFKRAATEAGPRTEIVSREKNWSALPELGLTDRQRDDIILALKPDDYCKGPEPDDDSERGGHVWIFGAMANGEQVYIKLKLVEDGPLRRAVCVSFHKAERPMHFPFRT